MLSATPKTNSTSDTFDNFIDTYNVPITNFIYNFYFNYFIIDTSNISIKKTVYPVIIPSINFRTSTYVSVSVHIVSNLRICVILDTVIDTTLLPTSNSTPLSNSPPKP